MRVEDQNICHLRHMTVVQGREYHKESDVHGQKCLHSVLGGSVHKSIGENIPALPQLFELISPAEDYVTFYELADMHLIYGLEEGNAQAVERCDTTIAHWEAPLLWQLERNCSELVAIKGNCSKCVYVVYGLKNPILQTSPARQPEDFEF
ncbi:hypothetical protein TNCV_2307771 [Trichonephila clavipes]|nr:hypothetical protein TNCV_2307771 [Trichonephila clavipes]